MTIASAKIRRN